jgi:hypothetical protein
MYSHFAYVFRLLKNRCSCNESNTDLFEFGLSSFHNVKPDKSGEMISRVSVCRSDISLDPNSAFDVVALFESVVQDLQTSVEQVISYLSTQNLSNIYVWSALV